MNRLAMPIMLLAALTGCDADVGIDRWYTAQQVELGGKLFKANCAGCHGAQAQGLVKDWRATGPDGYYPPPPLNGSAHAWHHPLPVLQKIIRKGGAPYNGKMPGFADVLDDNEQKAVIAWFQSLWSDEIYLMWQDAGRRRIELFPVQKSSVN